MSETLYISKFDETHVCVTGDQAALREMSDRFAYIVEGAAFMPSVQNRYWDGKKRLFDQRSGKLYFGLHPYVKQWCDENDYECVYEDPLDVETAFSVTECQRMFEALQLSRTADEGRVDLVPHDFQERAIIHAIQANRSLLLSPTASGKSLIIYVLMRYYLAKTKGKVLIVVPTSNLVNQMFDDFRDYADRLQWDVEKNCHCLHEGSEKTTEKRVVISTWQSLAVKERLPKDLRAKMSKFQIKEWNKKAEYIMDQKYFDDVETVFGDEAHLFAADELSGVMTKLVNARFRIGTTGTLKDCKVNHMILEGLFGPVYQTTTTRQLIDDGQAAQLEINILQLQYSDEERKACKKKTYQEEMDFLQSHERRNNFICNLAMSLKGNTLVLYDKVEKHGQIIHQMIADRLEKDRKLFFIHGEVKPDERNKVRYIAEGETNAIIVGSYGTYAMGVNIRNIDNVISVATGKSKIRLFQSIGRGLRLSSRKTKMRWYDISDDLSVWNKAHTEVHDNYSLHHLEERIAYYAQESFDYKKYKIELTDHE